MKTEKFKKAIKSKETAYDFLNFARLYKNKLTPNQFSFCLEKQKTAKDFRDFARKIKNKLTPKQLDICLSKQETAIDFMFFANDCQKNLNTEQLMFCQKKSDELSYITIKEIKKEFQLSQKDLAKLFNLKASSYANSTAKNRYEDVVCRFLEVVRNVK